MERSIRYNLFRRLLLLPAFFLIGLTSAFAINDPEIVIPLEGNSIIQSASIGPLSFIPSSFVYGTLSTKNIISLKIKEDGDYIGFPINATVHVKIDYKDFSNNTQPSIYKDLTVTYNPKGGSKYNAEQYFVFSNGTLVNVTVTANVDLHGLDSRGTSFLILTNSLQSSRDYMFNSSIYPAGISINPVSVDYSWQTPDELDLKWNSPTISNGTDIDIEWAWVNVSDASTALEYKKQDGNYDPDKVFGDNATRVTVPYDYISVNKGINAFKIPLLYESGGIIFFRLRFVQLTKTGDRIIGDWNTSSSIVSGIATNWQYAFNTDRTGFRSNGHMPEMNWQATTSYAEEGKRKTVISYFDGTLRTRQTVTKDNSVRQLDNNGKMVSTPTTVVAETMYDYQGRPVIQILPVPTISNLIEYTHQLNNFSGVTAGALPKEVYDIFNGSACTSSAPVLSDVIPTGPASTKAYGAANYYSSNNPLVTGTGGGSPMDKYIPNAQGRPFTETRYAIDGSGRIDAQSGVGDAHRLGSGHESKYIYTQPDQNELDGLFGTDVGDRSHYFKTLVKDANGQYSVSYTDMYGRTIATALAGENPNSLEKLPVLNSKNSANGIFGDITKDLLSSNVVKEESIESVSSIVLTKDGTATFNYSMDPQKLLFNKCKDATPLVNICYDCKYNLEITISNTCGGSYTVHNPSTNPVSGYGNLPYTYSSPVFNLSSLQNSCTQGSNPQIGVNFSIALPEGEYIVTKRLVLNTAARDWYLNNVVLNPSNSNNSICKTEQDFKNEIVTLLNQQNPACEQTCQTCNASLGISPGADAVAIAIAKGEFITRSLAASGLSSTPERIASIGASFDEQLQICNNLCSGSQFLPEELETIKTQMLSDMTPAGGQYARLDETKAENQVYDNANSEFEKDPVTGGDIPNTDHTVKPFNIFNTSITNGPPYLLNFYRNTSNGYYHDQNGRIDASIHGSVTSPSYDILDGLTSEQFAGKFKSEWANALLSYHPEYKRLQFAEANLKPTYAFNAELFSIDEISAAITKNWINGTSTTGYTIVASDPFSGVSSSGFTTAMSNIISNYNYYRSNLPTYPSLPAISMWQVATLSVFPPENGVTPPIITNGPQLLSSGLCDADKNKIWLAFRSLYTSERKILIYNFLNTQVPLGTNVINQIKDPANHYLERFMDLSGLTNSLRANINSGTGVDEQIELQYKEIAESYVARWRASLLKCEAISSLSEINRNIFIKSITDELIKICWAGSDENHPLGASSCLANGTVRNGFTIGNTYTSFEAAIAARMATLSSFTETPTCNSFVIDWPKPYAFPVAFSDEIVDSKEACVCTRLTALRTEATQKGYPVTNAGLVNYIHDWYQVDIPNTTIAALLAVCDPAATCNTINPAVVIPPLLQCAYNYASSCIDCDKMKLVHNQFLTRFTNRAKFGPFLHPNEPDDINAAPLTDDEILQRNAANLFYANYINQQLGFSKTWMDYFKFIQECDLPCSTTNGNNSEPTDNGYNCPEAKSILSQYYSIYANTSAIIETDMVTLAGNLTPAEGNKGVFDINGNLIGNTHGSSPQQVKTDFVEIWNSNSLNHAVGTLSLLSNGRFGLQLNSGKVFPCKGIVGMRYYQFDTDGTKIDGIMSALGSYINFGDGTKVPFDGTATMPSGTEVYINAPRTSVGPFEQNLSQIYAGYARHNYQSGGTHTITVYHTDMLGYVGFDNIDGLSTNLTHLSNLNGYFPQQTISIGFHSTQNASFNTFSNIVNFSSISGLENLWYGSGDGGTTVFQNNHLNMGGQHTHIKSVSLGYDWQAPFVGTQNILQTFPNWNTDYTDVENILIANFGQHITTGTHFYFPKLQYLEISMPGETGLQSEIDRVINEVAANSTMSNGFLRIGNNSGCFATSNLPAIQDLRNRGWLVVGNAIDGNAGFDRDLTAAEQAFMNRSFPAKQAGGPLPIATNFSRFFNTVSGTNYSPAELDALYAGCNITLNACSVPAEVSSNNCKLLCDHGAIPPPADVPLTCEEKQTLLAANLAEYAYTQYIQSIKTNFVNSWNKKCLEISNLETFTVTQDENEYHYTLYYYDQAGNLVQTVPPAGVHPKYENTPDNNQFLSYVKASRLAGTNNKPNDSHTLVTRYLYNSLNQVKVQMTPDAGESRFYYDVLGRLVVSQNAKQKVTNPNFVYSYTLYDPLGRITEVGQKIDAQEMDQAKAQNSQTLASWLAGGANTQITRTIYDQKYLATGSASFPLSQENLRNRVSYVQVWENSTTLKAATYYTYDIHGNVNVLLQDYGPVSTMATTGNRYKRIEYDYDLISGKVNLVAYQPGWADAFYHRYNYDAENRLTDVETSRDRILWEHDAGYAYYRHGPLARTEIGKLKVQGINYAYTLQGWLKAINPGTTQKTGGNCPPNMGMADVLILNDRGTQPPNNPNTAPPQYLAKTEIVFNPDFESIFLTNTKDNWETNIDPSLPQGCNADPAAQDLYDNDGTANKLFARDAYMLALNYYNQGSLTDYTPIAAPKPSALAPGLLGADNNPLYNGNISSMAVNIRKLATLSTTGGGAAGPVLYNYRYDQLNRITKMDAFAATNSNYANLISLNDTYKERISYDPNGNILTYQRNGSGIQTAMDQLEYKYIYKRLNNTSGEYVPGQALPTDADRLTNQLASVRDAVADGNYQTDIDNQNANNYTYDEIGNLIKDVKGDIESIEWTVYGKIAQIIKSDAAATTIRYTYDASGNRISKNVSTNNVGGWTETWYVRDATGNVMSVYDASPSPSGVGVNLSQTEVHLYGSSRLGIINYALNCSNGNQGPTPLSAQWDATLTRGQKLFELTNHLGNVLATVTDRRVAVQDGISTNVDYYLPDVATATDYYPFGMVMPGRSFSAASQYRYGFNGQEKSEEIGEGLTTAKFWEYDARVARRWNVDPVYKQHMSNYSTFNCNPIYITDHSGLNGIPNKQTGEIDATFIFVRAKGVSDKEYSDYITDFQKNTLKYFDGSIKYKNGKELVGLGNKFTFKEDKSLSVEDVEEMVRKQQIANGKNYIIIGGTHSRSFVNDSRNVAYMNVNEHDNQTQNHEALHLFGLADRYNYLQRASNGVITKNFKAVPMLLDKDDDSEYYEHESENIMGYGLSITQKQLNYIFNNEIELLPQWTLIVPSSTFGPEQTGFGFKKGKTIFYRISKEMVYYNINLTTQDVMNPFTRWGSKNSSQYINWENYNRNGRDTKNAATLKFPYEGGNPDGN